MEDAHFDAGRILKNSFVISLRNLPVLLPIVALIHLPLIAYVVWLLNNLTIDNVEISTAVLVGLGIPLTALTTAFLTSATMRALQGQPLGLGTSASVALRRFLPVIGASIAVGLCVVLGLVLLIVPGVLAIVYLWVTLPCVVVENLSIGDSLGRSRALTEGHRGEIFGIALIVFGLGFGLQKLAEAVLLDGVSSVSELGLFFAIGIGIDIILAIFQSTLVAATYFELRRDKEGLGLDEIAKAFD